MTNTDGTRQITGTIIANPNPLCFGQQCVVSWETNDPAGAEVRVSTGAEETLVTQGGKCGSVEIPWITDSKVYEFRLYPASRPDIAIDSVKARRELESAPAALREIAEEVNRGNIDMNELSQFISAVMPICLESTEIREFFQNWEKHGFHVTPAHFYQPIPDTQSLPETLWTRPSKLIGVDLNEATQLDLLQRHFPKFRHEYSQFATAPTGEDNQFYLGNQLFDGVDALVAYCMVRHFEPRLIVEVGSGFSSLVLGEAVAKNVGSSLICIEPFPREFLRKGFPGLQLLMEKKVQEIELDFFSKLKSGDILFIDSSHTVKIGGDVNYLFLEVLPRLEPGVIVHVHDIFLPFEYRRDWVLDEFRFWTEQYLLHAFLTFNSEFKVLMANNYLNQYHQQELKSVFPDLSSWGGGSFWLRRKSGV